MKQWLMILALVWAAATVNAAGEQHVAPPQPELCATVLTQGNNEEFEAENAPLLAIPCTPSYHLFGAEQIAGKGGRQSEHITISALHGHFYSSGFYLDKIGSEKYEACPPNIRAADRYIYYLKRIII